MAHACRVGKSYLTSSCKRIYNATPSEQLNYTRLAHARKVLVREPDRTITDVAFATGFNSSQYFANQFKKQFGQTPGNYRKGQ
jgi:AraC family L-rhamnose operon regulatory protein RhaS